jgi:hypothetical protein
MLKIREQADDARIVRDRISKGALDLGARAVAEGTHERLFELGAHKSFDERFFRDRAGAQFRDERALLRFRGSPDVGRTLSRPPAGERVDGPHIEGERCSARRFDGR